MATVNREEVTIQADASLMARLRQIASDDGRDFQAVVEDAIRGYVESLAHNKIRPEVEAHFQASMERHNRLYELLAK